MNTYLIGDVHGCLQELKTLLKKVNFNLNTDTVWFTGDLVSRGPKSLEVLRYIKHLGSSAKIVLGNHDLELINTYVNKTYNKKTDDFKKILLAYDANELIHWLRCQPLLQIDKNKKIIMSHAGISPEWTLHTAIKCAYEINFLLRSNKYKMFFKNIYNNNTTYQWTNKNKLQKILRLQYSINAFTRMRFCNLDGTLNMQFKGNPKNTPLTVLPWFNMPLKIPKYYNIIFGHWSALEGKNTPNKIYALDTGCCWGGKLTLLDWKKKIYYYQSSFKK
uniref:Bis(5'-nucleosyl)-tetraphosphatase, symmetrical n=1 Tax=Candidatus Aschnera chinzeii TaxID=1485666 RepID=A0AAT9G3S4_9ENTR|nr:MAG: bis(5'-nucleosyl)-tetraphosphatase (symmetrical) ApaH [Candidatus Aschnera chinzeii]